MELIRLDNRDKLTVCFCMNGHTFRMFSIIQMGKNGSIDLKITDFYEEIAISTKATPQTENGFMTENEELKFIEHLEISYHKDGTFLWKNCDDPNARYENPFGVGKRWIATSNIEDFLPILTIQMRSMRPYSKYYKDIPHNLGHKKCYICQCDELFEVDGTYLLVLMIVNKNMPFCCIGNSYNFSDKIAELNDKYYLCLVIQRHTYPSPMPYFSSIFKRSIVPSVNNIISPPNLNTCKQELMQKLNDSLFNPNFASYLSVLTGGNYFYTSKETLNFLKYIDFLWHEILKLNDVVIKALFTKFVLSENIDIVSFNKKIDSEKNLYLLLKLNEFKSLIST